jgi:hypothetical protein
MATFAVFLQERDGATRRFDCGTYKACQTKEDAIKRAQNKHRSMVRRLTLVNSWLWEAVPRGPR